MYQLFDKNYYMFRKLLLLFIRFYQYFISPVINNFYTCRFEPTCSEYTHQAILRYGAIKGCYLGIKRIIRCNPFDQTDYQDPVL